MERFRVDDRQAPWSAWFATAAAAVLLLIATSAAAVETPGETGSPSATTTINGKQLPAPIRSSGM